MTLHASRRSPRQRLGDAAEQEAADYLRRMGLVLVARNIRNRSGEIDLVMRDHAAWVFVEVRSRGRADGYGATASVDRDKRRRVVRTAQGYLQQHFGSRWPACRFDVVTITDGHLEWLPAAFDADSI